MKSLIVVGLGYGDEGKGSIVDFLCSEFEVDFVVKYSGGHQAGHRVVVGDKEHVFSQFGAGALAGVPTILDREFIIEPFAMEKEREALSDLGANTEIYVHPECPVTTPYHRAFCRLRESLVGHGSCGVGVGVTRQTYNLGIGLSYCDLMRGAPDDALSKLRRLRSWVIGEAGSLNGGKVGDWDEFLEAMDCSPVRVLQDMRIAFARICQIWRQDFIDRNLMVRQGATLVFEGSQGVLLDEMHGQYPYTTWSTVTPRNALEFPGVNRDEAVVIGVMRTYLTRHGNGDMYPCGTPQRSSFTKDDPNNQWNRWQGEMRRGAWTSELFQLSLRAAKPDCLAVNHHDVDSLSLSPGITAIVGRGPDRSSKRWLESQSIDRLAIKKRLCLA